MLNTPPIRTDNPAAAPHNFSTRKVRKWSLWADVDER
jgi:hypothetical protein